MSAPVAPQPVVRRPAQTQIIDSMLRAPASISPHIPPGPQQPIYIVSPFIFRLNPSHYMRARFTRHQKSDDPVFVFTWFDSLIFQAKTPPQEDKLPPSLRVMAHLSLGRQWTAASTRYKPQGMYPGHIFEDATQLQMSFPIWRLELTHQALESLDANLMEIDTPKDQAYFRFKSYQRLLHVMKRQYPTNPIKLVLSSHSVGDSDVSNYWRARCPHSKLLLVGVPKDLFGEDGANQDKSAFSAWDSCPLPRGAPPLASLPAFSLSFDTNTSGKALKLVALANALGTNLSTCQGVVMACTVLNEIGGKKLRKGLGPRLVEATTPATVPPIQHLSNFPHKPDGLLPDVVIRRELENYQTTQRVTIIVCSRDAGFVTCMWHFGRPAVYSDSDRWAVSGHITNTNWAVFEDIARAYFCCPGQPYDQWAVPRAHPSPPRVSRPPVRSNSGDHFAGAPVVPHLRPQRGNSFDSVIHAPIVQPQFNNTRGVLQHDTARGLPTPRQLPTSRGLPSGAPTSRGLRRQVPSPKTKRRFSRTRRLGRALCCRSAPHGEHMDYPHLGMGKPPQSTPFCVGASSAQAYMAPDEFAPPACCPAPANGPASQSAKGRRLALCGGRPDDDIPGQQPRRSKWGSAFGRPSDDQADFAQSHKVAKDRKPGRVAAALCCKSRTVATDYQYDYGDVPQDPRYQQPPQQGWQQGHPSTVPQAYPQAYEESHYQPALPGQAYRQQTYHQQGQYQQTYQQARYQQASRQRPHPHEAYSQQTNPQNVGHRGHHVPAYDGRNSQRTRQHAHHLQAPRTPGPQNDYHTSQKYYQTGRIR